MQTKVNLTFTGHLRNGFEFDRVADSLTTVWKIDRPQIVSQLRAGKPIILKKNLDQDSADLFRQRLEAMGLEIRLEPVDGDLPPSPWDSADPDEAPLPATPGVQPGPWEPSDSANLYAAPKADLKVDKADPGEWLDKPRRVPASHGWRWIKTGAVMFIAYPWKWVGMAILTGFIIMLTSLIPYANLLINPILAALLGGGMALAAQEQELSGSLNVGTLFKGFTHNRNRLILMGLLYLVGGILIAVILGLIVGKAIVPMLGSGVVEDQENAAMAMQRSFQVIILAWIVGMVLSIPLIMSTMFATIMVAVGDQKVFKSLKLSFKGCFKNFRAFLVFVITSIFIFFLISMIFSFASGLLMALFVKSTMTINPIFAIIPSIMILLVWCPLMIIFELSVYKSYRDIFYGTS